MTAHGRAPHPEPSIWILDAGQRGDLAQMMAVARRLTAAHVRTISLVEGRAAARLPRWPAFHGASLRGVADAARGQLHPPWPDAVFCAGRGAQAAARWIGRQAGGRTKLVNFLRPQAPLSWFDLVITMPPFRVPRAANVLRLKTMLLPAPAADDDAHAWAARLAHLPRPWIAVLVGGASPPYAFHEDDARRLTDCMLARVAATGGSILLSTSPRTPAAAAEHLLQRLRGWPHHAHVWGRTREKNPHQAFLTLADEIIVTIDSLSMMTEAAASPARRVLLHRLTPRADMRQRLRGLAMRLADFPLLSGVARGLRSLGLLLPPQDKEGYAAMLVHEGYAAFADACAYGNGASVDAVRERAGLRPLVEAECRRAAAAVERLLAES